MPLQDLARRIAGILMLGRIADEDVMGHAGNITVAPPAAYEGLMLPRRR